MEIPEMVSEVVLPAKRRLVSGTLLVVAVILDPLVLVYVNLFVVPVKVGRAGEGFLAAAR